jgi:hypothetical protein
MMTFKNKSYFTILEFVGLLFFLGFIATESLEGADSAPEPGVSLLEARLEHPFLTLVSFSTLVIAGNTVGEVLIYDDPTTKRPADYFELYDTNGGLLALDWFDRFGIQRMAVDRGLLEKTLKLEGVFVVLLEGDSI